VPAPDFLFALVLSHDAEADALLNALMRTVFDHVGLSDGERRGLSDAVRRAVGDGGRPGTPPCRVAFQATGGELAVTVARDGAAEWRDVRQLA
jgi:hypothetical protein